MKKILTAVLLGICVVMMCGCGGKNSKKEESKGISIKDKVGQDSFVLLPSYGPAGEGESSEVLDNEGDAQAEEAVRYELASMLPFKEGDDKICAIAYMGNTAEEYEKNLQLFFETYFPTVDSNLWQYLASYTSGGEECYLVIPRYKDTGITVTSLWKADDGTFETENIGFSKEEACLIYCNVSKEYANSELTISYNGQQYVIVPRLSAIDGQVEPMQVALDLTMDEVYQ